MVLVSSFQCLPLPSCSVQQTMSFSLRRMRFLGFFWFFDHKVRIHSVVAGERDAFSIDPNLLAF